MDKPICRLCGAKHYGREPHVFGEAAPSKADQRCSKCAEHKATIAELRAKIAGLEAKVSKKQPKDANIGKVDRREYMRQFMRDKRARAKQQ